MTCVAKVYCYGDSNTQASGYPELLRDMLTKERPSIQWDVENGGICGCSVSGCLPGVGDLGYLFNRAVARGGIDVIVLMLGTNDAINTGLFFDDGFDENVFAERLARLAVIIQNMASGAELQIVIPPPVSFEKKRIAAGIVSGSFPKLIPRIASSLRINCIDCFSAFAALEGSDGLVEDGIHLSSVGARLVACAILPHILNSFSHSGARKDPGLIKPAQMDGHAATHGDSSSDLEEIIVLEGGPCYSAPSCAFRHATCVIG